MPPHSRSGRRVLAALLALAGVAATCGEPRRDLPRGRPSERPPPAGTLRLGYPDEPATLNPVTDPSPGATDILRAVLPSFHLVTPELEYRPYLLAEEPAVEVVGERMVVRFRLRDDARWSDGTPISAEDVVFTWRVMTDPVVPVVSRWGFDRVARVVAESPTEGRIVLSPPFGGWRDLFSAGRFVLPGHLGPPSEVATWGAGPPVAGGPFEVARRVRGRSLLLRRNPAFFGPAPLAERIEVSFVPDPTTAVQLLERGELDAVAPMQGVRWGESLAEAEGVESEGAVGAAGLHLLVNPERIEDEADRRAIAGAVDRSRFAEVVLREEGRRLDSVLVPEQEGAVPAWSGYGAGEPQEVALGREVELLHVRSDLPALLARFVREELDRAGADVELVGVDAEPFHERFLAGRDYDLAIWESRGSPSSWLGRWFGPGGIAELDDSDLRRALSDAEGVGRAAAALADAQSLLAELVPALPLVQVRVAMGWRAGVEGVRVNPSADGPLWNAWEWSKR